MDSTASDPPNEDAVSRDAPVRIRPVSTSNFDIVGTYHNLLATDPELTKPVAAIKSLIDLLNAVPCTTVFETLDTVKAYSNLLKASVANPVPLTAGTELFLQYLVTTLREQEGSFDAVRKHLLCNGRLFIQRAIDARNGVAEAGWRYVLEGKCVLTHGASRSVTSLLVKAANNLQRKFKVVVVTNGTRAQETESMIKKLRDAGITVSKIPESLVAHAMSLVHEIHMVIVGAEAFTQNGGIIGKIGTYQIARLASTNKPQLPFYVAGETHKFTRHFPLNQSCLGYKQNVLDFTPDSDSRQIDDDVDYTPPNLIDYLFTEKGVKLPTYVFEQVIAIYGSLGEVTLG